MEKDSTSSESRATLSSDNARIKEICGRLNDEAIYHWSLHSKELFHSNVLGWFCEKYPEAAFQFLQGWAPSRDTTEHWVLREKYNLDLVVQLPGLAPVVIENKVFSPPDESQLDRYSEENIRKMKEFEDPTLLLLSLGSPNWDSSTYVANGGSKWRYLSYQDLASRLGQSIQSISGFDGEVMRRYVQFITYLQELASEVSLESDVDVVDIDAESLAILKSVRLDSAFSKLRARSATAAVRDFMKEHKSFEAIKFHAEYTKGKPLLEAFVRCESGDELGWQLQGKQWRLAVRTSQFEGETAALRELRYEYVRQNYQEWFDFSEIPGLIGRSVVSVPKNEKKGIFCGYAPNFVYWNRNLSDLTLGEIKKLSNHYITKATKWE
jgi:hypothetical protein